MKSAVRQKLALSNLATEQRAFSINKRADVAGGGIFHTRR
jgi:hypothetical protein